MSRLDELLAEAGPRRAVVLSRDEERPVMVPFQRCPLEVAQARGVTDWDEVIPYRVVEPVVPRIASGTVAKRRAS